MGSTINDLYSRQIKPLTDGEKLRLVELIAHELISENGGSHKGEALDVVEREAARERFRRHAGAASLGHATGASNESIDADLAREYGAPPESD